MKIADTIIVNVYLPCSGTQDRTLLYADLIAHLSSWCDQFSGACDLIIAGDVIVALAVALNQSHAS